MIASAVDKKGNDSEGVSQTYLRCLLQRVAVFAMRRDPSLPNVKTDVLILLVVLYMLAARYVHDHTFFEFEFLVGAYVRLSPDFRVVQDNVTTWGKIGRFESAR